MEIWFGIVKGQFRKFFTELPAQDSFIFLFPDASLRNCQWIFTKLGICIDIMKICFGIENGQS